MDSGERPGRPRRRAAPPMGRRLLPPTLPRQRVEPSNGCEVHGAANHAAVAVVAHVPRKSRPGSQARTSAPVVLADAGVENVNAPVDALIDSGVLHRLLAFTELKFSNSMTEAWWCSLKHQWLFLHSLDSVATIRRLVAFYVHECNTVLPHSAFRG